MGSYIYFPYGTNTTGKEGKGWENTTTHGAKKPNDTSHEVTKWNAIPNYVQYMLTINLYYC